MARVPGYNKRSPKSVTTDMLWDADEKAESQRLEEQRRQERIVYAARSKEEQEHVERKKKALEVERNRRLNYRWACSFCGSNDKEHDCLEYKRMVSDYTAMKSPIRAGVPLSWAEEFYGKQGKPLPLPKESYD